MRITRRLEFDAGHRIPDHASQCRHLHGHRYALEVTLSGEIIKADGLAVNGMVMDFADVKRIASAHIDEMKAKMLSADEVADMVGHEVGGVCPFGVNEGVSIYLDESLKRFKTVFPACGSSNSAIELTVPELEQMSHSLGWVDVCKGWESEGA